MPDTPAPLSIQPVVEVSIRKLATTVFSMLALMFALGALVMSSDARTTALGNKGTLAKAAGTGGLLEESAIPPGALAVSLTEFAVAPKMVMAARDAALKVTNDGAIQHTLAVEGQNHLVTPTLDAGRGSPRAATRWSAPLPATRRPA